MIRRSADLFSTATQPPPPAAKSPTDWSGLPIIFDEVFTGLFRLGRFTSASFLGVHPDISVHAKLLTGGLVPLATTVASESIFEAFSSAHKTDALLHGHSYTAHPVGCQVAVESLKQLLAMDRTGQWAWAKDTGRGGGVWSVWPAALIDKLCGGERVFGAWALGSVLAVHLRDDEAGYSSNAAASLRAGMMRGERGDADDNGPWNVHCRVLGNVLYLMAGQTTAREDVARVAGLLERLVLLGDEPPEDPWPL